MSVTILGIGTATPPHTMSQAEAAEMAADLCSCDPHQQRLLKVLYRRSGVKTRRTVVPHRLAYQWVNDGVPKGPSTGERIQFYEEHSPALACEAAAAALAQAETRPREITHLVTISCTGFTAPGVDVALINRLNLAPTTERVHVGFMGCHGAINGLRTAQAFVESNPAARVLLCAVECCSLHYRFQWDPEQMIGNALFSDGAAALVCAAPRPSEDKRETAQLQLAATGSCLIPNSMEAITWKIRDQGFEMSLSARVPELIEQHLRPWLVEWLAAHHLQLDDIKSWAVHPGGPRVLNAVEKSLGLRPDDVGVSREVLSEHGNMSSPTILFILDQIRRRRSPWPCVSLGFGPGLMAEAALFT